MQVGRLFTSYYAKSAKHPLAYAISCKVPTYYHNLKTFPALAPLWEMVLAEIKGEINHAEYKALYLDLITNQRKLNASDIVECLPHGAVLLCYESLAEHQTCHRRIVADWVQSETGIVVPEIGAPVLSAAEACIEF